MTESPVTPPCGLPPEGFASLTHRLLLACSASFDVDQLLLMNDTRAKMIGSIGTHRWASGVSGK